MRYTLKQRIWSKVNIPSNWDACWFFDGAHSRKRDGARRPHIKLHGRMVSVARIVCEWANGPAPSDEHHAGHTCPTGENAGCINPRHLAWQTPRQNLDSRRANKQRKSTAGAHVATSFDTSLGVTSERRPAGALTGLREASRRPSRASFDAPDNP